MAMFSGLMDKMSEAFRKFRSKGKLTEADVREGMREIKLALLAADVNIKVVKAFIQSVTERAIGSQVLESLMPAQQIVKIVNEELVSIMGSTQAKLEIASKPPTVIMMVGLQGAGKTTHSAKLAGLLKKQGKRPLLVACDVYRPAAITQLQVVGGQLDVPVFTMGADVSPVKIATEAIRHAQKQQNDVVLLDTAGRLHVDEAMMAELCNIKKHVDPTEILLVVDAMTGQDAVNVAQTFDEMLDISGVILTKMDGDTRGGAALSVRYITGKPIKFVGTGEKLDMIEPFYPDRMASRILDMGDVLSLIEKAEQAFDAKQAAELERKIRQSTFTLEDYLDQMRQMRKMGSMEQLLSMLPGAGALKDAKIDEKQLDRTQAIIQSMTPKERMYPNILNSSRKQRIAQGSGVKVEDVNRLLRQFEQIQKMMKQMKNGRGIFGKKGKLGLPF